MSDHIELLSFIIGVSLFIIGIYGLLNMLFDWSFPENTAIVILVLVILIIGFLMTLGGYMSFKKRS